MQYTAKNDTDHPRRDSGDAMAATFINLEEIEDMAKSVMTR